MLYRYLLSKKGFTFVEIMTVVIVLGILTAFAVPMFAGGLEKQKIKDCKNQQTLIEGTVQQAMYGMIDNGRKQEKINFSKTTIYDGDGNAIDISAQIFEYPGDGDYNGKKCFKLTEDENCFTLGAIRGGYRSTGSGSDYKEGCLSQNAYLKKGKLVNNPIYYYLSNQEIPVCPFADFEDDNPSKPETLENNYRYYIFEDGTCVCSNEKCRS